MVLRGSIHVRRMRPIVTRIVRIIIVLLALGAASSLAVAVEGTRWWSRPEVSIGPASSSQCFGGECQRASLDWVPDVDGTWIRIGVATWGAGLVSAACAIGLAAALASKRGGRLLARMMIAAALAAAIVGVLFIAKFPGVPGMSLDAGALLYFGGVIVAALLAITTLRLSRAPAGTV